VLRVVARHNATRWDKLCSSAGGGGGGGGGGGDASRGFAGFAPMSRWTSSGWLVHGKEGTLASQRRMMLDMTGMQARNCVERSDVRFRGVGRRVF
jgi:hypothetical protein